MSTKYFLLAKICDKRGMPLSVGWNSYVKTHPLMKEYADRVGRPKKEFLHAEAMAIIRLTPEERERADNITVYRFDRAGRPQMAKPCPVCQRMIEAAGIRHVYYTRPEDGLDMNYGAFSAWRDKHNDDPHHA